jgi:outer membrane receptor protein involved in Fe transport
MAAGVTRAQAQEVATATLDEVVVTAQKRVETLRDVPLSVAAVPALHSPTLASSAWTT